MDNMWIRLNHLVPEPQCFTRGNDYNSIVWKDERPQPTEEELLAVDVNYISEKTTIIENAFKEFQEKLELGFEYNGHTFQCRKDDILMWTEGVLLMVDNNINTANAIDIDDNGWEMTLEDMQKIRNKARATFFTHWNEYQESKKNS